MATSNQPDKEEIERMINGVPTVTDSGLQGDIDVFNGVTIKPHHLTGVRDSSSFSKQLSSSLDSWEREGRRGIWIMIPIEQAELIPVTTKLGFVFHHAQPGYVMLTKWLPKDEPNKLPQYAHHFIGVAGFVVNDNNEVLVIQERYLASLKRPIWKLPGGLADPGENIGETAVREVKEETGIETEFVSLLTFRHMLQFRWGTDDLYFVCLLRPKNTDIMMDGSEIIACKWIDLDEYISDPFTTEVNKMIAKSYLSSRESGTSLYPTSTPHYRRHLPDLTIYTIKTHDEAQKDNTVQPRL